MFKKYAYKEVDNRLSSLCGQLQAVKKMRKEKAPLRKVCLLLSATEAAHKIIIEVHYLPLFQAEIRHHAQALSKIPNLPGRVVETLSGIELQASETSLKKLVLLYNQLQKIEKQYGSALH